MFHLHINDKQVTEIFLQVTRYNTVGSHLPKHTGTKVCLDNWNIQFVCKAEYFPLNAHHNSI